MLVVGLGAVVLMVMSRPSGVTVLVVGLLVLFGLLVIEVLGRGARRAGDRGLTVNADVIRRMARSG